MLNTQKLLYILPDLAYIAELVPDKKPHSFSIQSFKQINGEFFKSNKLIPEHVAKLFNKLEAEETYTVVLPDFLFTNTIVSVEETAEAKVKTKLQEDVLSELKLTPDSHLIETTSLNQLKGTTRVQISAIDKDLLEVLQVAVAEKKIKVDAVVPLSWSVKSLISLEPSISVLQLGEHLYCAQHYIGVDQTSDSKTSNVDKIVETVKTLKGAEPSIQTLYLLSDGDVEKELKTGLKDVLPLQQMAEKSSDEELPGFVKAVIESALKTLSIPDFPAPKFELAAPDEKANNKYAAIFSDDAPDTTSSKEEEQALPKPGSSDDKKSSSDDKDSSAGTAVAAAAGAAATTSSVAASSAAAAGEVRTDVDMPSKTTSEDKKETKDEKKTEEIEEIKPTEEEEKEDNKEETKEEEAEKESTEADKDEEKKQETKSDEVEKTETTEKKEKSDDDSSSESDEKETATPVTEAATEAAADETDTPEITIDAGDDEAKTEEKNSEEKEASDKKETESTDQDDDDADTPDIVVDAGQTDEAVVKTGQDSSTESSEESAEGDDIDLSQFTQAGAEIDSTSDQAASSQKDAAEKKTIKNKSGVNKMLRMILITTGVFVLTVAIGIGVGMAILKFTSQDEETTPAVEVEESPAMEATPEPTPEPEASESAELAKEEISVLVVNATTKAGYAGSVATDVEDAGFTDVTAANADGEYETGNYIYMPAEDQDTIDALSDATGLDLEVNEDAAAEDSSDEYDAVIVLAE